MELDKTIRQPRLAAMEQTVARLVIFDGEGDAQEFDLHAFHKDVITFGRSADNDIVLTSPLVSRRHGCLRLEHGRVWIEDAAGSTNGLLYHGKLMERMELREGDAIRIDCVVQEDAQLHAPSMERDRDGVLLLFSCAQDSGRWERLPIAGRAAVCIGRDSGCDLRLNHPSVSKRHAILERKGRDWFITDNNSTNGVAVNNRLLRSRRQLYEKDVLLIAGHKLVFSNHGIYYQVNVGGISVEAQNVVKRVGRAHQTICDHANVFIKGGELVALIGGSGAGKTTLMNCLCGYSKPTEGKVKINGEDLYENLGVFRNIIGYVPQADIVYHNLTVWDMLLYAAKLRLPKDTTAAEQELRIQQVIQMVELQGKEHTQIKRLSGGQRKRVSIAVELLPDPNLLFLDEPTSGLDPGTERSLMSTLQKMAHSGKTVILVTHSTLQLQMCDKIAFMGKGGRLCYFGSYDSALQFFGAENIIDIYQMIADAAPQWKSKYDLQCNPALSHAAAGESEPARIKRKSAWSQMCVLTQRNLRLLRNDTQRLLLLLLQAPLLAFLIYLVADGTEYEQYEMTKSLLFVLACAAFWLGTLNAIQEVCKERQILKREYMTGVHVSSYLLSKLLVLGLVCAVQAGLLVGVFAALVGLPETGVLTAPLLEIFITTFLTALAATATGLFVSSLFRNADRAMTVAPLLLIPQILFSGLIFELDGATKIISWLTAGRWAMEGYGTTANLNDLPNRLQMQGLVASREAEAFFEYTGSHLVSAWGMLIVFVIAFTVLGRIALANLNSE